MSLWIVRGARGGEHQPVALELGFAFVGFAEVPDLSGAATKDAVRAIVSAAYAGEAPATVANFAGQLFAFVHRIQNGDLVAMPNPTRGQIALGRITGGYAFRTDTAVQHTRPVKWLRTDLPRASVAADLLESFGARLTVCQVQRNNAERRFLALLETGKDPGLSAFDNDSDSASAEERAPIDVGQVARDQIVAYIAQHFRSHDLARLVEAVLQADGFGTSRSSPGADGGTDVLGGRGPLGLDAPRVCVQVRFVEKPVDVKTLRELVGTMTSLKADQGLLVSWNGWTSALEREARDRYFSVRLWAASDLIDALLRNYPRLPASIQAELPLKPVWALAEEE